MRKMTTLTMALYVVAGLSVNAVHADNLGMRREMAKAMIAKGQTVAAAQQLKSIISTGTATTEDFTVLGEALRYSADFNGAVQAYTNALRMSPLNTEALGGLAMAYAGSGQYGRAVAICRTGLGQTSDTRARQYLVSTLASVQNMSSNANSSIAVANIAR